MELHVRRMVEVLVAHLLAIVEYYKCSRVSLVRVRVRVRVMVSRVL